MPMADKPPYRVPLMTEIADIPYSGYTAISTFSGCGGSSLGYRMAGFKVLWANEFIPAAQDTYAVNHPTTILDRRDIRTIKPSDVLDAIGLKAGELDVMDGSPPCSSFSTAGARESGWGKVKAYSDTSQRTDDLFFEYARLIDGIRPKVFVAENVSGLVKGAAKGYFLEILQALRNCGYNVKSKLLDAQWLGVPQQRQRIIFVGVRSDLKVDPVHPKPLPYRYTLRDALPWIVSQQYMGPGHTVAWASADRPSYAISQHGTFCKKGGAYTVAIVDTAQEPENGWNAITGWEREVDIDEPSPTIQSHGRSMSGLVVRARNAEARPDQAAEPEPESDITNQAPGRQSPSVIPATEKRKFSIAELRRICGFPDDFVLTGTYAQRWERLGRAVPPVMMLHIAQAIREEILCKIKL